MKIILAFVFFALLPKMAPAWETIYDPVTPWMSPYRMDGKMARARPGEFMVFAEWYKGSPLAAYQKHYTEAEHTSLSHFALQAIGASQAGLDGDLRLRAWDLFDYLRVREDTDSPIPTRGLPPPATFSGLPDYSFTLYDWVRKNRDCPLREDIDPADCHKFESWMGGATNSSHFGSLASRTYQRYHNLAVNLAKKAAKRRELFSAFPFESELYKDFMLELEHEALTFEAIGQHYLQDRWAIGHMWNRWNGPDADQLAFPDVGTNVAVGALTGIIHGAELMTNRSDPMNGAWAYNGYWIPSTFRLKSDNTGPLRGFGDDHLRDLFLSAYGTSLGQRRYFSNEKEEDMAVPRHLTYEGAPDVSQQRSMMLDCFSSSWAEVIEALGKSGNGYGAAEITLSANATPRVEAGCTQPWATNFSMALGFITTGLLDFDAEISSDPRVAVRTYYVEGGAKLVANAAKTALRGPAAAYGDSLRAPAISRKSLVRIAVRTRKRLFHHDFNGTQLAEQAFGVALEEEPMVMSLADAAVQMLRTGENKTCTSGKACDGSQYSIASYLEPENLDDLPKVAPKHTGRDKETLFLFYNKAHADHWCKAENAKELLPETRREDKIHACRYLGARFFKRTDPEYGDGPQKVELKVFHEGQVRDVRPVCEIFQPSLYEDISKDIPAFLHAGYVPMRLLSERSRFQSTLDGWCLRIPVVDYVDPSDDTVAIIEGNQQDVEITGQNFGDIRGSVFIWRGRGDNEPVEIKSWSENKIAFVLPDDMPMDVGSYCLSVRTGGDEVSSWGHFVLRREVAVDARLRGVTGTLKLKKNGCPLPK